MFDVVLFASVLVLLCLWVVARLRGDLRAPDADRDVQRRTLRYDADRERYRWRRADGTETFSRRHPDLPGGAWYEAESKSVIGGDAFAGSGAERHRDG